MQKGPSEIAAVQISRTEYITKCYQNMVDQIPQKRILRPRNQLESSDTCHQDYVVTWELQRRRRLLSIQALICF